MNDTADWKRKGGLGRRTWLGTADQFLLKRFTLWCHVSRKTNGESEAPCRAPSQRQQNQMALESMSYSRHRQQPFQLHDTNGAEHYSRVPLCVLDRSVSIDIEEKKERVGKERARKWVERVDRKSIMVGSRHVPPV